MERKMVGLGMGSFLAFWQSIPENVHAYWLVTVAFCFADAVTGVTAAAVKGKLSSYRMRTKTVVKLVQYFAIAVVLYGAAYVTKAWQICAVAPLTICLIEISSIMENLVLLQAHGANMGPFGPILTRVEKMFAAAADAAMPVEVATTTTIQKTDSVAVTSTVTATVPSADKAPPAGKETDGDPDTQPDLRHKGFL